MFPLPIVMSMVLYRLVKISLKKAREQFDRNFNQDKHRCDERVHVSTVDRVAYYEYHAIGGLEIYHDYQVIMPRGDYYTLTSPPLLCHNYC